MKKHLLLLIFALAASAMQAQNGEMFSILYHETPRYFHNNMRLMQQRDGDFIMSSYVFEDNGSYTGDFLGNMLYKISLSSLTITDSLFVADPPTMASFLLSTDPQSDGNIRAKLEYHEDCDSTFVRISHFPDNDLHANPEEDIVAPVSDGVVTGGGLIDYWGDLIMEYYRERPDLGLDVYDSYIAHFSPDGTLQHQILLPDDGFDSWSVLSEFKESPPKYYEWGRPEHDPNNPNLALFVIDSLLNTNTIAINRILSEDADNPQEYLDLNGDTRMIPIGENEILVASKYVYTPNNNPMEYGVAVAKYDIRTNQQKGYIVFNDYPGGSYNSAQCLGIKMMTDGTVYFLYKETGYPDDSFIAVKMDTDLNMEWKRFCKTEKIKLLAPLFSPILKKDGQGEEDGIAWAGYCKMMDSNKQNLLFFILNHEGPVGMNESGIEVRPYCFYPNPAKNQIHMEFSPDVQPARVELYDLQGRLVHTQRNTFESINMSQLPAGTYTMRVVLENGESYSDKVVKE